MFSAIRKVSFQAQIGPYQSLEELQAAVSRELPGTVLVPSGANLTQGPIKNAAGVELGLWHGAPFTMLHPVSFTAYTGPCATLDDLETVLVREVPGAVLVAPKKHFLESEHSGDIHNSAGQVIGQWIEVHA